LNRTLIVHVAPEPKLEPQVFVWLKLVELEPVSVMPVIVNVAGPTFCRVTVRALLVVPDV